MAITVAVRELSHTSDRELDGEDHDHGLTNCGTTSWIK
jgi:hypothetical protein